MGRSPIRRTARKHPIALKLGFSGASYGYSIELGLPSPSPSGSAFSRDPLMKVEALWTGETLRGANVSAERKGSRVRIRDEGGVWRSITNTLDSFDSMMTHCGCGPRDECAFASN